MQSALHGNVTGHQAEKADLSAFKWKPPILLALLCLFLFPHPQLYSQSSLKLEIEAHVMEREWDKAKWAFRMVWVGVNFGNSHGRTWMHIHDTLFYLRKSVMISNDIQPWIVSLQASEKRSALQLMAFRRRRLLLFLWVENIRSANCENIYKTWEKNKAYISKQWLPNRDF